MASTTRKVVTAVVSLVLVVGAGYGIMAATETSRSKLQEELESRKPIDDKTKERTQEFYRVILQNANSKEPAWKVKTESDN